MCLEYVQQWPNGSGCVKRVLGRRRQVTTDNIAIQVYTSIQMCDLELNFYVHYFWDIHLQIKNKNLIE